jgi:NitT/TauT family transport system substrate-binding protein
MDSKVKLGISFAIILAVIISSNSSINWSVFSGLNSNTDSLTGQVGNSKSNSLNLGYFPNVNHAQAIIGIGTGNFSTAMNNFDENGNFTINPRVFNSNPSVVDALYSGQVDVAYVGPNSIIDGLILSGPEELRIISGVSSGGASFVVRNDSGIDSVSDLGGKKFASPQLGNTQDVALRKYLVDNGFNTVDKGGNVTVLPITNADILTVFLKGEIDGAWVPEPWATRLVQEADGKVLLDERDLWPNGKFVTGNIIVRTDYLRDNPDVIKRLLQAHVDETLWINNNMADAVKEFNTQLDRITGQKIDPQVLSNAYTNLEITYDPLKLTLYKSANDAYDLGFIEKGKERPNLSGIYDTKLLDEVLAEKGLPPLDGEDGGATSTNATSRGDAVADIVA